MLDCTYPIQYNFKDCELAQNCCNSAISGKLRNERPNLGSCPAASNIDGERDGYDKE